VLAGGAGEKLARLLQEKLQKQGGEGGGEELSVSMMIDWWLNAQNAHAVDAFLVGVFDGLLRPIEQHGYYVSYETGGVGHDPGSSSNCINQESANLLHSSGSSCATTPGQAPNDAPRQYQHSQQELDANEAHGCAHDGLSMATPTRGEYDAADIFERLELARAGRRAD
jgi:hypothetical protein